ncbi:MAG: 4-(cytidine 5'-diphospho)-2-C-methyl-D-erythritol kinase [Candidatus Omnitrophica bacterium]|nr:4-(cytidine 5'-diphospho)-2-C-methyl-D-erythritol kinase [Candidatus Omnitrophota bacterium]
MNSIELTAPAKVNLVLRVLSKRKDSYHNIYTLFERISLADHIKITRIARGITVVCDKSVTGRPQDNIAYKAAELILKTAKVNAGIRVEIKKRIPIAAGLGGGSSDAAAVLTGINKLLNLRIPKGKLMRLGAKLGADVPFFIFDTPFAIGRGVGDKLQKLNLNKKFFHILIYPGFKVATKDVYRGLSRDLTNNRGGVRITLPKDWNSLERLLHNDLEAVVAAKKPVIGIIIKCLASSLGRRAIVSGSGPSVFCLCPTRKEAMKARVKLLHGAAGILGKRGQIFIVETKR